MDKILVLAPHTDDESLGCGGMISKLVAEGKQVYILCFTACSSHLLLTEYLSAIDLFKVWDSNVSEWPLRNFDSYRQGILQSLIELDFKPDTVLAPSRYEIHQDHQVITREAVRAFKHCTILGYELPWNNIESNNQCTVSLAKEHVDKKIEACSMYKSQSYRPYMDPEFIRSWAKMRGVQNGCSYAEVFEVIKLRL